MKSVQQQRFRYFRRHRRVRISNQIAAFAAIMLFASTQVAGPLSGDKADNTAGALTEHNVLLDRTQQNDSDDLLDLKDTQESVSATPVSSGKSKKRLNLSLFRFRR